MRPPPNRSIVYIDGFNFYYGAINNTPHKWLNLSEFCRRLRKDDDIRHIRYFTSVVKGRAQLRQYAFLGALGTLAPLVTVIQGKFKEKRIECRHDTCTMTGDKHFVKPEEKRTDVAIGVTMLDDAYRDLCDRLVLISGDSDLVPAVTTIRQRFPMKRVIVYAPARDAADDRNASELIQAATSGGKLPTDFLQFCHFPDTVTHANGQVFTKPDAWKVVAT